MITRFKNLDLPEGLERQFRQLRLRLLQVFSFQAVTAIAGAVAVSFLILWISDRFWDTPFSARMALWVVFFFVCYTQLVEFLRNGVERSSSPMRMARQVQRRYTRLGDRLSGILELADPRTRPAVYSQQLYEAAIGQVAGEASGYDFNESVPVAGRMRLARFVVICLGLTVFIGVLFPDSVIPTGRRLVTPWEDVDRFSMVEIGSLPSSQRVPHGEPFVIEGTVNYRTFWKPSRISFSIQGAFASEAVVKGGVFTLEVPGCIDPSDLTVTVGDSSTSVAIDPVFRPSLDLVRTTVHFPEYLHYDDQSLSGISGTLSVVEGSQFDIEGIVTRELSEAQISMGRRSWAPLNVETNRFLANGLSGSDGDVFHFRWTDSYGFEGTSPWSVQLETRLDSPPTLQLQEITPNGAYLETELVPAVISAMDDFGVSLTGIEWKLITIEDNDGDPEDSLSEQPESGKFSRSTGSYNSMAVTENYGFSPRLLGVPPDSVIEVRGFAADHRPGSEKVYTEPMRILVVSIDRHAELLRQNLEAILSQSEDILRAEENISEFNRMAMEDLDLEAPLDAVREQIEANAEMQEQNARDLERLAQMGQQLLREAMRNPNFESEAIREWNETLEQMQSLGSQQMPQISRQMQSAASQSSSEQTEQELAEAQEMIEDILQDLADLQNNINEGLDELQAMTLAQRLRALGEKQTQVIDVLKKSVARTIGLTIDELSAKFRRTNEDASASQKDLADQADALIQEISRFAERTQLEPYQVVSREMDEQKPVEDLSDISGKIQKNVLASSMSRQSGWAEQFREWAKTLEPPESEGESGQSGEGSQSGENEDNAMLEMMIKLLRMREKEIDIQKQTRLLDGSNVDGDEVADSAARLSGEQLGLMGELDLMNQSNPLMALTPVLKEGMDRMLEVSTLLGEPRVDEETDRAQSQTVNTLTDAINIINELANNQSGQQQQQQQQQQQTTAQQMAFLMQMMSQTPTPSPMPGTQGNPQAGGETGADPGNVSGDVTGRDSDSRRVERASGSLSEMPEEFRPMLEKYFQLLEEIQE